MIKSSLAAGCAAAALLLAPGVASAQDAQAALEARIAQLEAELNALKSEVVAARTQQAAQQQDIIRLETRPTPAPAPVQQAAAQSDGFRIGDHTVKFGGFV
ncbi:porin, partial [Streptomyces coelicoflavus ZG0656]